MAKFVYVLQHLYKYKTDIVSVRFYIVFDKWLLAVGEILFVKISALKTTAFLLFTTFFFLWPEYRCIFVQKIKSKICPTFAMSVFIPTIILIKIY